jgi:hypothetical protein
MFRGAQAYPRCLASRDEPCTATGAGLRRSSRRAR